MDTLICGIEIRLTIVLKESSGPLALGYKSIICNLSLFLIIHFLIIAS